jgi:hypothetical protein
MDVYVKRIQSRIKRRYGISIPLPNIRNIFPSIVQNTALPTDEELWQIVDYFNPSNAHQPFNDFALTTERSDNVVEMKSPEVSEDFLEEIPQPETFDIPVEDMPCLNPPQENQAPTGILLQASQKQALITQQASALSIALDPSELKTVASSIADEYQTFEDAVKEVTALIKTILHQRHLKASNTLREALQDLVGTAQGDMASLSQQATLGFATLATGLQEANTDFKSRTESIKTTLSQFLL